MKCRFVKQVKLLFTQLCSLKIKDKLRVWKDKRKDWLTNNLPTIIFFIILGSGICWLVIVGGYIDNSCLKETSQLFLKKVSFWQKSFSILVSIIFIVLMICRCWQLKKIELKDKEDVSFFDYFSPRSYISRHKLKIPNKEYFALWKNHYPYSRYKTEEEFDNSQKVRNDKIEENKNDYQESLKEKLQNRILKSFVSFIWICIFLAFVYASSCVYGIYCLKTELETDITRQRQDSVIVTVQSFIFTYQSPLLENTQKMQVTLPVTMLKYTYNNKQYHANNLQIVSNKDSIYSIIKPGELRFYMDKDSLRSLNKNNEYPELNDFIIGRKLKSQNDVIIIKKYKGAKSKTLVSDQLFINSKEKYYHPKKTCQNTCSLIFDLVTTILLLFVYYKLSNTSTQKHKQYASWNIAVYVTLCAIFVLLDIYVARLLTEDSYILAHWIIASIASLFAAMTIASFASRMYPQYQKNNFTKSKILDIAGFFMIYLYACANVITPINAEILAVDGNTLTIVKNICSIVCFAGISSLYFVMFRFSKTKNMQLFFIH